MTPEQAYPQFDWSQAACRGEDPELFFPDRASNQTTVLAAKAVCHRCPLLWPCQAFGLDDSSLQGIFGGLTGMDRRRVRRDRAAPSKVVARDRARLEARRDTPPPPPTPAFGGVKRCPRCSCDRPAADFAANRRAKDGCQSWCKPCQRQWAHDQRQRGAA